MSLLQFHRRAHPRRGDGGYMLLLLMVAVAVLVIGLTQAAYNYRRMILRDREVEMIHRGEQYARAVKRFYRKNGRYPVSLDQLENFNKMRFLRRRYKDPMSPDGQWKLVRPTDIRITATGITTAAVNVNANGEEDNTSPLGGSSDSASGGGDTSSSGDSSAASGTSSNSSSSNSGTAQSGGSSTLTGTTSTGTSTSLQGGNNAANGQTLGGGEIYGVVSKSKKEGFHSFGDKSKYNEWFFIYVPTQDRGQLLTGPYNPKAFFGTYNTGTGTKTSGTSGTGSTSGSSTTGTSSATGTTGTGTLSSPQQ